VANVCRGVVNRMESGYLLKDVLEKLNVKDRTEAATVAVQRGIISLE